MDEKEIATLLATLKDTSLPDEVRRQALEQLTIHDEQVRAHLRTDFKAALPDSDAVLSEADAAFARLQPKLSRDPVQKTPAPIFRYFKWAAAAAAVLLCIAGAWYFLPQHRSKAVTDTTIKPAVLPMSADKFDTIRNSGSSTTFHRLPDGSTVHLEAGGELFFRDGFSATKKEIFLKGSALFTVHKEERRPFSVYVNGIQVLDLGTVFAVSAKQHIVRVKLIQGKVMIRPASPQINMQDISLAPGQEFRIDTSTKQFTVRTIPGESLVRDGKLNRRLAFKNASLQEVFDRLEKECTVTIHYNKTTIRDMSFTGTFDAGANVRNIIATICMINGLRYELRNNSIYIHR